MKRKELYPLFKGLKSCSSLSHPSSYEFAYRIVTISETIENAISRIEKSRPKYSDEYIKFLEEQKTLLESWASKNEDGSFVFINQEDSAKSESLVMLKDPIKYYQLLDKLKEKYKKAIDDFTKLDKKFEEFLDKEATDIKIDPIPKKYLPPNISVAQLKGIKNIIEK